MDKPDNFSSRLLSIAPLSATTVPATTVTTVLVNKESFRGNALLAALPWSSLQPFAAHLRPLLFHSETTLFEKDSDTETVYFPKSGMVSLVLGSASGVNVEVGIVGPEGVTGLLDALTGSQNMVRGQVQIAGNGWSLPAAVLREEFAKNAELRSVLLGYQRAFGRVASQNMLCNRLHAVEPRLARWLLLTQDRIKSDELELTHEFIATMLGSRRVAVTLASAVLREAGLINYRRGLITIVDRPGLEELACECYPIMRAQFDSVEKRANSRVSVRG